MDPVLIGMAGNLLGSLLGKPKTKYVVPDYQRIRDKAEAAGFNPLTALQSAPGAVVTEQNTMGAAIADSAMLWADSVAAKRKAVNEALQQQNNDLRQQLNRRTLRPDVGGIYSNAATAPSIRRSGGEYVSGASIADRLNDPSNLVAGSAGGFGIPDRRLDRGIGVFVGGQRIAPAPGWSPAQAFQDEYGDFGESVYGIAKLGADVSYTRSLRPGMTYGSGIREWTGSVMPPMWSGPLKYRPDRATRILNGRIDASRGETPMFQWGY